MILIDFYTIRLLMSITELAVIVGQVLKKHQWKLVTAESCTGGGLAYYLTTVPGSSDWFDRGFVTYSNISKQEMINVSEQTLKKWGAVSEQTAREMATGALHKSSADISMAITGIAGPDGGTLEKPVGTVWFAWQQINSGIKTQMHLLDGDRTAVREKAIELALEKILTLLKGN